MIIGNSYNVLFNVIRLYFFNINHLHATSAGSSPCRVRVQSIPWHEGCWTYEKSRKCIQITLILCAPFLCLKWRLTSRRPITTSYQIWEMVIMAHGHLQDQRSCLLFASRWDPGFLIIIAVLVYTVITIYFYKLSHYSTNYTQSYAHFSKLFFSYSSYTIFKTICRFYSAILVGDNT